MVSEYSMWQLLKKPNEILVSGLLDHSANHKHACLYSHVTNTSSLQRWQMKPTWANRIRMCTCGNQNEKEKSTLTCTSFVSWGVTLTRKVSRIRAWRFSPRSRQREQWLVKVLWIVCQIRYLRVRLVQFPGNMRPPTWISFLATSTPGQSLSAPCRATWD